MDPFVDLEILGPGKELSAAGEGTGKRFFSRVDPNMVYKFVLGFESFLLSGAVGPVAGVICDLRAPNVVLCEVVHNIVQCVVHLPAHLLGVLVHPLAGHLLLDRLAHVAIVGGHVAMVTHAGLVVVGGVGQTKDGVGQAGVHAVVGEAGVAGVGGVGRGVAWHGGLHLESGGHVARGVAAQHAHESCCAVGLVGTDRVLSSGAVRDTARHWAGRRQPANSEAGRRAHHSAAQRCTMVSRVNIAGRELADTPAPTTRLQGGRWDRDRSLSPGPSQTCRSPTL